MKSKTQRLNTHKKCTECLASFSLEGHLEKEAIDGLFARAKALLARGTYGNFKIDEINAHLHLTSIE